MMAEEWAEEVLRSWDAGEPLVFGDLVKIDQWETALKEKDVEITRLRAERDALREEVERLKRLTEKMNTEILTLEYTLAPFMAVARAAAEFELVLKVVALGDALAHPTVQEWLKKEARDA